MQIKFKKQIDIELDKADLLEAVRDLLAKNGQSVTTEELEAVKFINSPQTGIRAELKITEESGDASSVINGTPLEPATKPEVAITTLEAKVAHQGVVAIPAVVTHEAPTTVEYDDEEPGVIAANTVDDVIPSISEIKAMVEENEAPVDSSAAPSAESLRTSLF